MATEIARLRAYLDADTSHFDRSIRGSESHFAKFGHAIKVGALAAGAAIGTGLAFAAKAGFDEFNEGQKVAAQTAAVLKSTGGAAHVTAKQIDGLASSLMMKTGIDDEAIKSGANLLLTFRDIRNETGKGNDIFNQATKTVQDMSVALGQDTKASAIQLGKALNDPIRGITALRRVGVSFNDAQTEQITKLQESGKTMEAQKLILRELQKEFGGSAEAAGKTFSGQLNILKETFRNTAGEIVGRFVPILVSIAKVILPLITKGLDIVADAIEGFASAARERGNEVHGVLQGIGNFVSHHLIPFLRKLWDIGVATFNAFKKVVEDNRKPLERIGERLLALAKFLQATLLPVIRFVFVEVLPRVLNIAIDIIDKVSAAIETVVKWVGKLVDFVREHKQIFLGPFTTMKNVIEDTVSFARDLFDAIKAGIDKIAGPLSKVADAFGAIKGAVSGAAGAVGGFFGDGIIGAGLGAAAGGGLRGVSPTLFDDYGIGQAMGLTLSSGYRPGAVTSTGNPSLHGVYPSKAIDMAGSESAMRRYFLFEVARGALTGLREVIHSPFWWHPGSGITRIPASAGSVLRDHYSHVHVGSYDQGGFLRPGWNLAYNGLGRPEPVGAGNITLNVNAGMGTDGRHVGEQILRALEDWRRRGGR